MTYKDRLIRGLLTLGWTEDKADRCRYTAFHKEGQTKVFVGANGALRTGRSASSSISIGDATNQTAFYKALLERGTPAKQLSLHRLAAEFGQDTDEAKEVV